MERRKARVLRAAEIDEKASTYSQTLNPDSCVRGTEIARMGGLARGTVSWASIPPGKASFAYHAHDVEEEWMFILSGRGVALVDGEEIELGPGDFVAFPAPQVAHLLRNPGPGELTYLMGGERVEMDVVTFPALERRYLIRGEDGKAAFHRLGEPEFPFHQVEEP